MKTTLTFEFNDTIYDHDDKHQINVILKAQDLSLCAYSIREFFYQKVRVHEKTGNLTKEEYKIYQQVFEEVNTIIDDHKVRDVIDE
jgi:hypothetical protein